MSKLEYAICSATDLVALSRQVNEVIQDGWEPIGGAFFGVEERTANPDQGGTEVIKMAFHQAVKKEEQILRKLN